MILPNVYQDEVNNIFIDGKPEPENFTMECDRFNYHDPTDSIMIEKVATSENNIIKKTHTWTNFVPNSKIYPQMFKTLSDNNIVSKYLTGSIDLD